MPQATPGVAPHVACERGRWVERERETVSVTAVAAGLAAALAAVVAALAIAHRHRVLARRAETEVARLRRELQAERHAAGHDPLTGLPNRRAFYCSGSPLVADAARRPLVAVLVDLDDFKRVNDTLGHVVGDRVLVAVARRFADIAGGGLVARLGGDEFAGLLDWPTTDDRWLRQSGYLLADALAAPVEVAGSPVAVTASVGLAPVSGAADLDDVLGQADAAMYQAKTMPGRFFVASAAEEQARPAADPRSEFAWLPAPHHGRHVRATAADPTPRSAADPSPARTVVPPSPQGLRATPAQ
jgi:diguanylate cyclase (GGDEF)-like protein